MWLPPIDWIEKAIRINSITHHSNEEIVRFLVPLLEEAGLTVHEHKVVENGESFKNLVATSHGPEAPDLLVMNTHLDTVSFGDKTSWTKTGGDPFQATRVRDRIYGLGSADVKLDFLCKLWAARVSRPWKKPFALVGTYGEERGLVGAMALLQTKKIKPKFALVGEPSNLELIYAHKGHIIFTVEIDLGKVPAKDLVEKKWKGKSAHSSTPDLGDNALRKGLNDVLKRGYGIAEIQAGVDSNKIPDLCEAKLTRYGLPGTQRVFALLDDLDELARELKKRKDPRFSPSHTTISLNRAVTEGSKLHFTFDLRNLPDIDNQRLKDRLGLIAKRVGVSITSLTIDEPLKGQKNGKLMKAAADALKSCGVKVVRKTKASSTEAALYQKFGAEAIVFGPGLSVGNVHRPNEYNSIKQMEVATKFYTHILKNK
jgi:acetylornithine deacetylase/succinyl-diaminopimelate desuccinylase-like protein